MGHDRFEQAEKRGGFDGGAGGVRGAKGNPFGGGGGGMGAAWADIFNEFFGGGGGQRGTARDRGRTSGRAWTIDLEEAYEGAKSRSRCAVPSAVTTATATATRRAPT